MRLKKRVVLSQSQDVGNERTLYDENDGWHVDYVRLRVKAVKVK